MSIFDQAARVARRLGPAGELPATALELYGRGLAATEQLALRALRARMDLAAPAARVDDAAAAASPRELMASLLERSLQQDTAGEQRDVYVSLLKQLVPDEARIIAALANDPPPPLIHVLARGGGERILENASLVGRTAALTLPVMTPLYVTHLRQLGLVETGPEDEDNARGYEMLMADKDVRAALKEGELSKLPAKTVRRTLVLTPRGRALWEAAQP